MTWSPGWRSAAAHDLDSPMRSSGTLKMSNFHISERCCGTGTSTQMRTYAFILRSLGLTVSA